MEHYKTGYIKLMRSLLDWEWYQDANTSRLFIHGLLKANYKTKEWQGHTIHAGSFVTSIAKLALELNLTEKQIRIALNKLKRAGEWASKTTSRYSIITIKNWNKYQSEGKQEGTQRASRGQAEGKQRATTKEYKECKERKNISFNNFLNVSQEEKSDPYINPINSYFSQEYQKVFNVKPRLLANQRNKLAELNSELDDFKETLPTVLNKLRTIEFDLPNFNANYTWLLTNDNYIKTLEGTFDKRTSNIDKFLNEEVDEYGN